MTVQVAGDRPRPALFRLGPGRHVLKRVNAKAASAALWSTAKSRGPPYWEGVSSSKVSKRERAIVSPFLDGLMAHPTLGKF